MAIRLAALGLFGLCMLAPAALAQPTTTSPAPEAVAVTVYRAPGRDPSEALNLRWLGGYALVTETRRIEIPQGEGNIRFEGVAGGIIPESAIVTGLPEGVVEKNQDAYLLSPGSLLALSVGRRVHLRRTSSATGQVREQEAVIRSGPDGAVVLQTEDGFEALRCTALNETIVYPSVPEGLSAKPTLSVRTRSDRPATAMVTLSYLAGGFDWQANYIATLAPSGDRMDLFAWVTLANGDQTSFVDASTQTVAGRVQRETDVRPPPPSAESLELRCWPDATTSDIESRGLPPGVPPPPPPPPPPVAMAASEAIVVTGSRMSRKAVQEELGDLKLYRIPDPVTVAARSQKQVAMLERSGVQVKTVYRRRTYSGDSHDWMPVERILTTRNRAAEGLGLPLPAGQVVLFGAGRERPILLGQGFVDDKAVGEDVEIVLGPAAGVSTRQTVIENAGGTREVELVVTNDGDRAVPFEAEIEDEGGRISSSTRLSRREGRSLWSVTVPANGTATLRYRFNSAS